MKKLFLALIASVMIAAPAMAAISVGAELGLGIAFSDGLEDADFGDKIGFPIINVNAMYYIDGVNIGANPIGVGLHVGYDRLYSFEASDLFGKVESTISEIPIMVMAELRPIAAPLFINVGLGLNIVDVSTEIMGYETSASETDFGFLVGAGYAVRINDKMEVPVGIRYNMTFVENNSVGQLQLTAGFTYKL
ncbi:MAG: porin family protein [Candidatus Saccharibacteria bacterium]|nr:porin family protein [Candidatus Saccharibacteria bacterium]